jgi:REP element-mobilizing transposase RayT
MSDELDGIDLMLPDEPEVGFRWVHLIFNTRGSWLPGDERGFRSREHRVHSSGDYKHRPPTGEHAGLRRWVAARARSGVRIPVGLRGVVVRSVLTTCEAMGVKAIACTCGANHVHLLAKLPTTWGFEASLVRALKGRSSRALTEGLPGSVWSRGYKLVPVKDRAHQLNVYRYLTWRQERGAVVWDAWRGERGAR